MVANTKLSVSILFISVLIESSVLTIRTIEPICHSGMNLSLTNAICINRMLDEEQSRLSRSV